MAVEESSQGDALGPNFSEPPHDRSPDAEVPDLYAVLSELFEALCVVEVTTTSLEALAAESPLHGFTLSATASRHGFEMLSTVYKRFDRALVAYATPDKASGGDQDPDCDDAGLEHEPDSHSSDAVHVPEPAPSRSVECRSTATRVAVNTHAVLGKQRCAP